jgi:hypothetical protein
VEQMIVLASISTLRRALVATRLKCDIEETFLVPADDVAWRVNRRGEGHTQLRWGDINWGETPPESQRSAEILYTG